MKTTPGRHRDGELRLVTALAVLAAVLSFSSYLQHNSVLLYGDAVAHINIARRVFDSKTPGLLQLGTVWLPLPHLLMIPFLLSKNAWQSGAGGSVPSLVAFIFAIVGIFRLVRGALSFPGEPDAESRIAAWLAALGFGANPNLIYLQSTAMTEPLYLAFFIWATLYFVEFVESLSAQSEEHGLTGRSLVKCALCLAAAELTRYDGWFAGAVFAVAVIIVVLLQRGENRARLLHSLRNFLLIVAATPVLWLAYNWIIYRNPLEFANGPYSAKAIEQRSATPGFPPHPGSHAPVIASRYFLKSAEDNLAPVTTLQRSWIAIAILGSMLCLILDRRLAPLLLLWLPLPFYALSIAYSGVPLFVPDWWPFSYYNVRYGIELLPAIAVFFAITLYFLTTLARPAAMKAAIAVLGLGLVASSYLLVWRAQPVSFREAWVNSRSRIALERELAANLRKLPPDATLLMYLGDHVGALQYAGIPISHVIQEGNHRTWKQPSDPNGLWERALANPGSLADYAISIDDDPVARSARQHGLTSLVIAETPGQPPATIYAAH